LGNSGGWISGTRRSRCLGLFILVPLGSIYIRSRPSKNRYWEKTVRMRPVVLLSLVTLLFGCAELPAGFAGTSDSYDGPEYGVPSYPGYGPGYLGSGYYGSDALIGGGGYWVNGKDRDAYWYHRYHGRDRDPGVQGHEPLRHENEAQARAQAWQQLQQQKAAIQATQVQAAVQRQQAAQQQAALAAQAQAAVQQQRAAVQAAQARALQERAQAVQQIYQQRAQMLAAQQQAIAAARARGMAQ